VARGRAQPLERRSVCDLLRARTRAALDPFAALALLLLGLLAAPPAHAQRILHEYVPPPGARRDEGKLSPTAPPDWIRTDDKIIPRPEEKAGASREERVLGEGGGASRARSLTMDRTTTHDGVLNYTAEFNPSVVPHKRMAAFDAVGKGYTLKVSRGKLREVKLTPRSSPPGRDPFWGSLVVKLRKGVPSPIPSVAPGAAVLSYRTTPRARLTFLRDSADNMWVRSEDRGGELRLVFLTDAPRSYFSPEVPRGVSVADVPAALKPRLPPSVKQTARRVLRRLKIRRGGRRLAGQLDRLVGYFRSFQAGKLPSESAGDTYLDIALSQRGVCRHRAFAFTITAQALGLPARYVQNEAHAFAEVYVPRLGWARIDLGGASSEMRVHNGKDREVHRPGPDPFPRPSRYAGSRQGTPQTTRVTGLDQRQRRQLRAGTRGRYMQGSAGPGEGEAAAGAPRTKPEVIPMGPTGAAEPPPERIPVQVKLSSPRQLSIVYRGATLAVAGRVLSGERGIPGLQVDLLLSRDGRIGYPVGSLVTDGQGRFRGSLKVPRDVEVGKYRVYAETPGDSRHGASRSR